MTCGAGCGQCYIHSPVWRAQVDEAVEQSVVEMCADQLDMDFEGFMKLLRVDSADSLDSLDQYDSRVESQVASGQFSPTLPTVIET